MQFQRIIYKLTLLFLLTFILSACGGADARKAQYLARGKAYLEQENYEKAKIEIKNVLQIDPKHAEAYHLMGKAEYALGNIRPAIGAYMKAYELDPDNVEVMGRLGFFNLLIGAVNEADEISQKLLAINPDDPIGKTIKGAILSRRKDDEQAIKLAKEVISANPKQSEAIDLLAAIYAKQGKVDKAISVYEKGIADNPEYLSFYLRLVQLHIQNKNLDKAEELQKKVIALDPDELNHRSALAIFYSRTNQLEKAEKVLRDAIQADPNDSRRYILYAEFLANKKGAERAERQLYASIKQHPEKYELRFSLGRLYEGLNQPEKAEAVYREIVSLDGNGPHGLKAKNALAQMKLNNDKFSAEAQKLIGEVLKENPRDNVALKIKGKIEMAKGNAKEAIVAFRSILKDQPNSHEILILLAEAHLLDGHPELADQNLTIAIDVNPNNAKVRLDVAKFRAKMGEYDQALKRIDEVLVLTGNDVNVLLTKVDILRSKGDTIGMEKVLKQVEKEYPDHPIAYYRLGQLYSEQKKYDSALKEFEVASSKYDETPRLLAAIVRTFVAQGETEKAIVKLQNIARELPDDPIAYELLGEVYLAQNKYSQAEERFGKAIEINPKWSLPYGSLGKLHQIRGDFAASVQVYKQGLEAVPEDATLLFYLAGAYEQLGEYDKAVKSYELMLSKDPKNALATNNLASLLVDHKGDAESLRRARSLAKSLESLKNVYYMDTVGWVYLKSGEVSKALPILETVINRESNIPIFHYHVGMAYYKDGNTEAAKYHLAKATTDNTEYPGVEEAKLILKKIQ